MKVKKIVPALLTVVMLLAMSVTVMAEEVACTKNTSCAVETHDATCPMNVKGVTEWVINTAAELQNFSAMVTNGANFGGVTVKLGADIDLQGIEWKPIGGDSVYFKGEFDGQGHTISNMTNTEDNVVRKGLFGLVEYAYIHDLTLKNVTMTGTGNNMRIGAVAGNLQYWNVVKNVTIDGINIDLTGNDSLIGTVVGYEWKSQMDNVVVKNAEITVDGSNTVGGLIGYGRGHVWDTGVTGNNDHWIEGTIFEQNGTSYVLQNYTINSKVEGITINAKGSGEIGGFFGGDTYNSHSNYFKNCSVTGMTINCDAAGSFTVGGFAAYCSGTTEAGPAKGFDGCSASGTINGARGTYGGFIGQFGGRASAIRNASADVDITCTGAVGGFAGTTASYSSHAYTFENCTASGDVTGNIAGGFIGREAMSGDGAQIYNNFVGCEATGAVTGTSIAGGFTGEVDLELPATNWNTVNGIGKIVIESCTASSNVTVGEGGVSGGLIGLFDNNPNADYKEGTVTTLVVGNNDYAGEAYTASDDFNGENTVITVEAKIGSTYYESAEEAFAAAEEGDTVILLEDVSVEEEIVLDQAITINTNGKDITAAEGYTGDLITVGEETTVTLDDITFTGGTVNSEDGNLVIAPASLEVEIPAGTVTLPEDGTVTITNEGINTGSGLCPIDTDNDGEPDLNIDTDNDGKADINLDVNYDGIADLNIDTNSDKKADMNLDTDNDGEADEAVDTDGDGKPNYVILEGKNSAYMKESGKDVTIKADGVIELFKAVKVDGTEIAATNYTAVSGSTIVTLKTSYLETLSVGSHTVTVVYENGEASAELVVAEETLIPGASSNTGDSFTMVIAVVAFMMVLATTTVFGRSRRYV